jgi:hypothetical protein
VIGHLVDFLYLGASTFGPPTQQKRVAAITAVKVAAAEELSFCYEVIKASRRVYPGGWDRGAGVRNG